MENKEDRRIYTLSQEVPAKAVVKMSVPLIFYPMYFSSYADYRLL